MKRLLSYTIVLASISSPALAAAVENGSAAELAAHRLERLVLQKKVPLGLQTQFLGLELNTVAPGGPNAPTFEVVASQDVDAGKPANKVILTLDETGKMLSFKSVAGSTPSVPLKWSNKDPLTLAELSLHHLEHLKGDKTVLPFFTGFKALRLSQMQHGSMVMPVVEMLSSATANKLILNLDSEGELVSFVVAQPVSELKSSFSLTAASLVVSGNAKGVCSPLRLAATKGVQTKLTLKATGQMFLLTLQQAGISLMAGPGGSASKSFKIDKAGTYAFQCGVHGGKQYSGQLTVK
ncbi:MAG: hypothetical protein EOP06_07230 [Proteobacteria bacterium]|nr:MAG: hypothetical protein EOP06_07230 [Pseudomonadota bacterium]